MMEVTTEILESSSKTLLMLSDEGIGIDIITSIVF